MIKPVTKTIGEHEFTVQPWPARQAFQNQLVLGRLLAPSLKDLGKAIMATGSGEKVDLSQPITQSSSSIDLGLVGSAFSNILSNVEPERSDALIAMMLSSVFYKGQKLSPEITDTIFMGEFESLYKLFGFVLEVNFGSFLAKTGIGKLLNQK